MDNYCYKANTCPLPVFAGWTSTDTCPSCGQLACEECDVADRYKCSKCKSGINTHLSGLICVCDTNYIPVTTAIDTAALGLWNNQTPSLTSCKLNCTAAIPGCQQNDCTNATYCTSCFVSQNYVLLSTSLTTQTCILCNVRIQHCTSCVDSSFCSTCNDGSYLLDSYTGGVKTSSSCPLCSSVLPNCVNCTDANTCTDCDVGYVLNSTTKKCYCNVTYNSLPHCKECLVPDTCSICVDLYFLNSTTKACQPCSDIHSSCENCTSENTCTVCASGYALDSVINPGSVKCRQCRGFIDNCTFCSSSSICTNCDYFYGLSGSVCETCNTLLMPGCESCEDASLCLKCDN